MNQNNILDKIFPRIPGANLEKPNPRDMIKFIESLSRLSNHTNDRPTKSINPLQTINKPFLSTQPLKGTLHHSDLIGKRIQKEPYFAVEPVRLDYDSRRNLDRTRAFHTVSPTKKTHQIHTPVIEKKIKQFTTINNNIDALPSKLFRKSMSERDGAEQHQAVASSERESITKKLLGKLNFVQEDKRVIKNKSESPRKCRPRPVKPQNNPQQLAEKERKMKLQIKKQISEEYAKPFNPPSNISAASYIIYEPSFSQFERKRSSFMVVEDFSGTESPVGKNRKYPHSHKVIASHNSRTSMEIASLTKIMTCIVALEICDDYCIDASSQKIAIGKFESNIIGTSARIYEGELYTLEDLYYGLMLPSGNDASIAIAVWGGRTLLSREGKAGTHKKKEFYARFIEEMNSTAKRLGMLKTTYANSHGLVNPNNRSCAYDLAILCEHAMGKSEFRKIVSCRQYETEISYDPKQLHVPEPAVGRRGQLSKKYEEEDVEEGEDKDLDSNEEENLELELGGSSSTKSVRWENTHKLLHQKPSQYIGIKTGITNAAGPCLASCIADPSGRYFIIIVLNCQKPLSRFRDTESLRRWLLQKEGLAVKKKSSRNNKAEEQIDEQEGDERQAEEERPAMCMQRVRLEEADR